MTVDGAGRLLRVLGVGFGVAVTIGNTIGAGIFRAPGQIAASLPDPTLILAVWTVGGVYALLGAFQLAELGVMLPRSGGQYVFSRHAFGEYAGFVVGWSDWLSTCGTTAAVAIVIAQFSAALLPGSTHVPTVAATVAVAIAAAQWRGIREGSGIQQVTSAIKALVFAALIAVAFTFGRGATTAPGAGIPLPEGFALAAAFVVALQAVIYTYDGWSGVIYFSEEVREPVRDIPRALILSVVTILAIYVLMNAALLFVMPVPAIAGQEFAAGAAAATLFGERGDTALRFLTIVSMLSAVNAYHLMASRVLFAIGRDGLFSRRAAAVNAGGTPTSALFLSTAVAVLFIVFGRTFERVIAMLAFFFVANYTLSFAALFVLRVREPDRPRPYRAWGYPWTTGAVLIGSVLFLVGAIAGDTRNSLYALFLLAASYPVFRGVRSVGT